MFLGKIKENSGKISFFVINALLIAIGFLYFKQKNLEDSLAEYNAIQADTSKAETPNLNAADAQALQEDIAKDRQQKLDSIANNPAIVTRQETVAVTKTIPGATRKVTVPAGTVTSQTSTATVKKSAPAPTKSTKTS